MTEPIRRSDDADHPDAPFYWGWRLAYVDTPEGRRLEEIPLTPADVLDPQEGDYMVQNAPHATLIRRLAEMLDCWFRRQGREMTVLNEVKIRWGVPGLPGPAPDVAVIPTNVDITGMGSYAVGKNSPLPCLVIEVVSERYARIDYGEKVDVYERAGVPEYLIIDIEQRPLALTGFRRGPGGRFRESRSSRRWQSRTTGLLFVGGTEDLSVRDAATGERLLSAWELEKARQAAARRAEAEAEARRAETAARRIEATARRAAEEAQRAAEERAAALTAELGRLRRRDP